MPKVREVFERAYGPVPEGATCHVGAVYNDGQFFSVDGFSVKTPYHEPVYAASNRQQCVRRNALDNQWNERVSIGEPIGGDIGDQPAEAFSPVFQCAAYDAALDALTKEESATAINRTMRKYDLALHKLAKSSEVTKAQPDPRTVIALADAMAVAEQQAEEPGSCHADDVRAYNARERYMEASRKFWASLSADGTGESPVLSTHLDVMGKLYEQDETEDTIDDGFGNAWGKCRPDCGMYVVRPGKAACGYEGTTGCGFYPGDDVKEEAP